MLKFLHTGAALWPDTWIAPREHGAWAMLLVPFVAALVLARRVDWEAVPAAATVIGIFLIREPAVVLGRQARIWKERRPEADAAFRCLLWYTILSASCGAILLWRLPITPLLALGSAALLLTVLSTWLIVHNRQRSVLLQLSSAAGLNASALVAWLAVRPGLEAVVWWLWALLFAHSAAAVLVVHARLEARVAARSGREPSAMWRRAAIAQLCLAAAALAVAVAGRFGPALALALSASVHGLELAGLRRPESLQAPLRQVGRRALALSLVFTTVVLAALW